MTKIAIYNGFSFHYEMFGYIIHYCKTKNYDLTIYSDDNLGYKDYYKPIFSNEYRPVFLFELEKQHYDFIFLITDDDRSYKINDNEINKKTICIDHYYKIRNPVFEKRIATRPFSNEYYRNWALPVYPIKNMNEITMNEIKTNETNEINIVLLSDDNKYTIDILNRLQSSKKIILYAIARNMTIDKFKGLNMDIRIYKNIHTNELINILLKSSFIITDVSQSKNYVSHNMSGAIPLAFSTLTPLIISKETNSYYKFKNVIEFNSIDPIVLHDINIDDLKKERDEMIEKNHELFDSMIKVLI